MKDYIIIPVYNEEKKILETINLVKKNFVNIIVVNDGSKDRTQEIISKIEGITVLNHVVNLGKGSALKTGCEYAKKQGAEKIVVLDGDGQHDPSRIPHFLEKLNEGNDIVFGYREHPKKMPWVLKTGNWFLNHLTESLFKIKIKDTQSGYRAFTVEAYNKIKWESNGYSMESEMIAKAAKKKLKYSQIPIETIYNDKYKGTTILDGTKIALDMCLWRIKN